MSLRIALATCRELPDLDPDDQPLIEHFTQAGIEATPVIWSDPTVNWDDFDRVIVRNTWDYTEHCEQFLAWVTSLSGKILNSPETIGWSTNKTYLRDLQEQGIPVIATQFISDPKDPWSIPSSTDFVVKPTVSAGSRDTLRLASASPSSLARAQKLIDQILATGKSAMIQPYLDVVDADGETALLYIGGRHSHAIRKGPLLKLDQDVERVQHVLGLYVQEEITPREPRPDQREVADRVLNYVTERFGVPLYARVDLLDDAGGAPHVLEVELVEPSIFFGTHPEAYGRFVAALLS